MPVRYSKEESPSIPPGNGDIGERSKCRQLELEWMKFLRAKIKLTSSGRTDSIIFGLSCRTFKCGLEFIEQYNGKKASGNFILRF